MIRAHADWRHRASQIGLFWTMLLVASIMLCPAAALAQAQSTTVTATVTFQSADLIYIDEGRAAGLAIGDIVEVQRGDSLIAELQVEHVASHSASCRVLKQFGPIAVGDHTSIEVTLPEPEPEKPITAKASPNGPVTPDAVVSNLDARDHEPTRLNGSIGLTTSAWNSAGADRDYMQSILTANLYARRLGGRDLTLTVRSNGRRNDRGAASSVGDEWSSNVYVLSLGYESPNKLWAMEAGRFLPGRLGLVGYIDGALLESRLLSPVTVGIFGGLTPQWQFASHGSPLRKFGGYLRFEKGSYRTNLLDVSVGVLGEYDGTAAATREVVFSRGRSLIGQRWSTYHSVEVDVNRGWRQTREGSSLTLSTANLSLRYQASRRVSLQAGYDHHRRVLDDQSRETPDSLFDQRARQRWRTGVQLTLPARLSIGAEYGFRTLSSGSDRGSTYTFNARKGGVWHRRASVDARITEFTDESAQGSDITVRASQTIMNRHQISLMSGWYTYHDNTQPGDRDNRWTELGIRTDLGQGLSGNAQYRLSFGDDLKGSRIQLGLTYQL